MYAIQQHGAHQKAMIIKTATTGTTTITREIKILCITMKLSASYKW
jgi:hypothetical protein